MRKFLKMDKSAVDNKTNISPADTDTKKAFSPPQAESLPVKKRLSNKTKNIIIVCTGFFTLLSALTISLVYYRRNFTPNMIVKKAVANLIKQKKATYNATARLTFQYADKEEKIDLNGLEAYSLLKKAVSDNHEMTIQGEHDWSSDIPNGKYDLTWSVSDKKVFGLEGYYMGYQLYYKVNPYVYSDLVDKKLTSDYSEFDLKDLLSKTLPIEYVGYINEFRFEELDFEVIEVFQDDYIKGDKAYHYKVKVSGEGTANKILSGVKIDGIDFWIGKKNLDIEKIKGNFSLVNIGVEGNNLDVLYELTIGN